VVGAARRLGRAHVAAVLRLLHAERVPRRVAAERVGGADRGGTWRAGGFELAAGRALGVGARGGRRRRAGVAAELLGLLHTQPIPRLLAAEWIGGADVAGAVGASALQRAPLGALAVVA